MKTNFVLIIVIILFGFGLSSGQAEVSREEAAKLKTTLTPFGAERAGNAEGTIPEWTGGITTPPATFKKGEFHPDPYKDDKVLFTISAQNYMDYADKLSDGQKALFKKYPETFKMNVYPTRRSAAAPEWVYENTFKNAINAKLVEGGDGVENAFGGIPFPIPKTGVEVVWNHLMRWIGQPVFYDYASFIVYENGQRSRSGATVEQNMPYYGSQDDYDGNSLLQFLIKYNEPTRRKGEIILIRDPVNQVKTPRQAWQYIPGQRRVRRAPTVAYDTPDGVVNTYDDAYMYNGSPDRYNWRFLGKKELYVLYNGYKLANAYGQGIPEKELLTINHPNPEYCRWELHRVWIVEGTLKEGKRHIYAKRVFYIDEDSWNMVWHDRYDGRGDLWRVSFVNMIPFYEMPATVGRWNTTVDLFADLYGVITIDKIPYSEDEENPDSYFTPQGVRKMSRR